MLRVCQVVANINESVGGPAYSVTQLAQAIASRGMVCDLFTLDYPHRGPQLPAEGATLHSDRASLPTRLLRGFSPRAARRLQAIATECDLIHNHGLWMFPNLYARQAAVRHQLPLVVSPRGMLEPWSLKYSWYKKWPAWWLYERENLRRTSLFHATSQQEAHSIRQLGYRQPIAVVPNGIDLPSLEDPVNRELLTADFSELSDRHWILFLSRLHPKKGIDNLLKVWENLAPDFRDWHLVIAGADHIGYRPTLEGLCRELNLQGQVTFTGLLSGDRKLTALRAAEVLVLPSHSENFGIVVAEALAAETPAIATRTAPWEDLDTHECGWWIENRLSALRSALRSAMELSAAERQAMGRRGRALVASKYAWPSLAEQMQQVYHWLTSGGTPPNCVQLATEASSLEKNR